eukprot:m.186195 g.186195  ORF g.186195 m.186195 type:complete len:133 (-) comp18131_c1_seq8:71-469(-)
MTATTAPTPKDRMVGATALTMWPAAVPKRVWCVVTTSQRCFVSHADTSLAVLRAPQGFVSNADSDNRGAGTPSAAWSALCVRPQSPTSPFSPKQKPKVMQTQCQYDNGGLVVGWLVGWLADWSVGRLLAGWW